MRSTSVDPFGLPLSTSPLSYPRQPDIVNLNPRGSTGVTRVRNMAVVAEIAGRDRNGLLKLASARTPVDAVGTIILLR